MVARNGVIALITAALVVLAGCGGKDSGPSGDLGLSGDAQFSAVAAQVTQSTDWMVSEVTEALATMPAGSSLDNAFLSGVNADSVVNSTWKVVYHSNLSASVTTTVVDSLQYKNNGNVQPQSLNADQIDYRHTSTQVDGDTTNGYTNYSNTANVTISALDAQMAVVNGTSTVSVTDKSGSTWRQFDITVAAEGLNLQKVGQGQWDSKCPQSGTITATIALSVSLAGAAPVQQSWTANVTYSDGTATVQYVKGTASTSSASSCQQ